MYSFLHFKVTDYKDIELHAKSRDGKQLVASDALQSA